jgi:hypothetical protein
VSDHGTIRTRYGVTISVEDGDEEIRLALTDARTRRGMEAYLAPDEIHALVEALTQEER